jgi:hypothetical protein
MIIGICGFIGLNFKLPNSAIGHRVLEDCCRQIDMLQDTLKHLAVKELA